MSVQDEFGLRNGKKSFERHVFQKFPKLTCASMIGRVVAHSVGAAMALFGKFSQEFTFSLPQNQRASSFASQAVSFCVCCDPFLNHLSPAKSLLLLCCFSTLFESF
jgi:hypothetical protein